MIALFLVKAGAPLSPEIVAAFVHEQDEAHKGVVAKVKNLLAAGPGLSPDILEALREEGEKKYKAVRHQVLDLMDGHHPVNHKFYKEEGEAGHKLCHIAKSEHVTLIVMGTRGLGTLRRTILGSVSDYVLHHAHCPVIICRQ